jgi:hypothetical protein
MNKKRLPIGRMTIFSFMCKLKHATRIECVIGKVIKMFNAAVFGILLGIFLRVYGSGIGLGNLAND